jgi:uncharacterized RDD family membrane protein YckC
VPRDPTAVLASRIGAFIVDGLLVAVVLLVVFWRAHLPDYVHVDPDGSAASACDLVNRTGRFAEVPDDRPTVLAVGGRPSAVPLDARCLEVGSEVYLITGDQLRALRTMGWQVGLSVTVANLMLLQGVVGASVGKWLFGLRVIGPDARKAEPTRAVARTLVLPVDVFCFGIVGLVSYFTSRGHRRLGDLAAGTFVVHRSSVRTDEDDEAMAAEDADEPGGTQPDAPVGAGGPSAVEAAAQAAHERGSNQPARGAGGATQRTEALPPPIPVDPEALVDDDAEPVASLVGTDAEHPPPVGPGDEAPAWDPVMGSWVRYQPSARTWFRWDVAEARWVPRVERRGRMRRPRLH